MRSVVHIFNVSHKIYISVCLTLSVIRLVDSGNAYFLYVIGRESFGSYIKIIQFIETERRTHTSVSKVIIATNNDLSTARYQIISSFISDTLLLSKKVSEIWIKIQHFYTCRYVSDHTKWILRCRLHYVAIRSRPNVLLVGSSNESPRFSELAMRQHGHISWCDSSHAFHGPIYRWISSIRRTKSHNLNVSRLILHLLLRNLLKPGVKWIMQM